MQPSDHDGHQYQQHVHHQHQGRHQQQKEQQQQQTTQDNERDAPTSTSSIASSWGVTYLLQSAKRGWQRHKSPHVVSLHAASNCLDVTDAATSRLQVRLVGSCCFLSCQVVGYIRSMQRQQIGTHTSSCVVCSDRYEKQIISSLPTPVAVIVDTRIYVQQQ